MRAYTYYILDEELWNEFKKRYKSSGLGNNIQDALTVLIAKFLDGTENEHPKDTQT